MKKVIFILTIFLVVSCGSLKKQKESIEIETKNDFNASKIDYKRFRDSSFIFKPFDATRPMIIGKDTIVNTIIENHYRDRLQIVKDTIHKTDTQIVEVEKMQKEKDNTKLLLGIAGIIAFFLFVVILVIIFYFNAQIKKLI
jgi:hypothetical protein